MRQFARKILGPLGPFIRKAWEWKAVRYLRACGTLYFSKGVPRMSAGLSYFLLLTVFPLLICVSAFLGTLNLDPNQVLGLLETMMPEASLNLLKGYLGYIQGQNADAILWAGLVMVLTSASAAFRTLMRAMADIHGTKMISGLRGFILSILFPLALLLTIYLSVIVIVTGDWLVGWVVEEFNLHPNFFLWDHLRFLLLFLVFLLFVLLISRAALPRGTPHLPIIVGSILSACALVAASALFSWFIGLSTRYSMVYGSLMSIVVLMVWLYLCGNILLGGNIISSVWYEARKKRAGGGAGQ